MDEAGFLAEPHSTRYWSQNVHLRRLDDLDDVPCVLALGDPGLGKSWEIGEYVTRLKARLDAQVSSARPAEERDVLLAFDLRDFGSTDELRTKIFEAPAFTAWRRGAGNLYLVLDSLDESSLTANLCSSVLLEQLEEMPVDRLRLRIGCRTAVRPPDLRDGLQRRFAGVHATDAPDRAAVPRDVCVGDDQNPADEDQTQLEPTAAVPTRTDRTKRALSGPYVELEIAILSRADARAAAVAELGRQDAADRFLEAVTSADVGAFASRPQTLAALLDRFARGQSLDVPQVTLFRDLCHTLCDPSPVRPHNANNTPQRTNREERYRLAGRISAAMLLGNRPIIHLGPDPRLADNALDIATITGVEHLNGIQFRADESALWEAVNTALFTASAHDSGLASHLTFAEFLAADWVSNVGMPLAQVTALITDHDDPDRRVIPQLRQVAAWLAAMRTDVFDAIARAEPDIILWSDVVQLPAAQRPAIVEALLAGTTANRILNPPFSATSRLDHLAHPGLADQLSTVICDTALPDRTRELALNIARATNLAALTSAALEVATDDSAPLHLRVLAARLVGKLGREEDRWALMPLAADPPAADEIDDLKGAALAACWKLFTPDELYDVLTGPKRANYSGDYAFALHEIADGLTPAYARAGARWLAREEDGGASMYHLTASTIRLALDASDDPSVLSLLADYSARRLGRHEGALEHNFVAEKLGFVRAIETDVPLRRRLVNAIAERHPECAGAAHSLTDEPPRLFWPDDVPWAMSELAALPHGDPRRACWSKLIWWGFHGETVQIEAAFAHRDDPDIPAATWNLTVDYQTPEEALAGVATQREQMRLETAERERRHEERRRQEQEENAPPAPLLDRVAGALSTTGEVPRRWRAVLMELLRSGRARISPFLKGERMAGLRSLRGTSVVEPLTALAHEYLRSAAVPREPYPDGQTLWIAHFGFAAGTVLLELSRPMLDQTAADTWSRWMRVLVGYFPDPAEGSSHVTLLRIAAERAPEAARTAFVRHIDRDARDNRAWLSDAIMDIALAVPGVEAALARRVARGTYAAAPTERILTHLLKRDTAHGLSAALQLFRGNPRDGSTKPAASARGEPDTTVQRERRLAAGTALLMHAPAAGWVALWSHLNSSDAAARLLLEYAARNRDVVPAVSLEGLGDSQLADLYLRISHLYPPEDDPWHVGVYSPGPRDNIVHWRGAPLRALQGRRTETAVGELERIARCEPARDYLVQTWLEAKAALRTERWRGTEPANVVRLAERSDLRLVESSAQLLDVILESLGRMQQVLQGQWRSVGDLWNEYDDGNEPKSEEHLSNTIARFLEQDLSDRRVVIGRELRLQIPVPGAAGGLRTDIDVQAPAAPTHARTAEMPRVIIEVKGSWNPQVRTAMEEQLVQRYLVPHGVRSGLFLVGHFTCASWRESDHRYNRSRRNGAKDQLEERLQTQAAGLSNALLDVRALVLDTSLPDDPQAETGRPPRPSGASTRRGARRPARRSQRRRRAEG